MNGFESVERFIKLLYDITITAGILLVSGAIIWFVS